MTRAKRSYPKSKRPQVAYRRILLVLAVALVALGYWLWVVRADTNTGSSAPTTAANKASGDQSQSKSSFDKNQYSVADPASPWVVVNKGRQLSSNYLPSDLVIPSTKLRRPSGSEMMLRAEAAKALALMFDAASTDGVKLMLASGYRPYSMQAAIYQRHVNDLGQAQADRVSARPGHSEHQTGWVADVAPTDGRCLIEECFGELAEGLWIADRAAEFGFIIRYPANSEELTGYAYEPWHIRYVGQALSAEIDKTHLTLEQYFNLPTFGTYPELVTQL